MGTICFFNTAQAWGGGEKWHFEMSQYLHAKGKKIIVVAHPKSVLLKKLRKHSIPNEAISVSNLSFLNPFKRQEVKKCFKRHSVQTLVMNLSGDVKIAGMVAKSLKTNRIIYRRGSAIPIKNNLLNRYIFQHVLTEIIANSEATKKTILENNADLFDPDKIVVIHNGVDIPDNLPDSKKASSGRPFTLLNLGRLEYQKNQTFLLDVAEQLAQKNYAFKMLIGGEGSLRPSLQAKIEAKGLQKYVELQGFIEDPYQFMSQGDVFLLPSHWEGFGYVLAEAALSEKACIAFNISSNPELILDKRTGFLTKPNSIEHFVQAIETIYKDRQMAESMGKEGRKYIIAKFEKEKKLKQVEDFLIND